MAGDDVKDLLKIADSGSSTSDALQKPDADSLLPERRGENAFLDEEQDGNQALALDLNAAENLAKEKKGGPEQLGFDLRFEAGRALLALENTPFRAGVEIKRALFEVPDVAFPLEVSGGASRFQGSRLNLRAIELGIAYERLFLVEALEKVGLKLHRERMRGGGIELLLSIKGPYGDVPFRAHALVVPAGDAGIALVMHEVIPFARLPRTRLSLAPQLLNALSIPGGELALGMVRRADPFSAVLKKLLPAFGWKIPSVESVKVEEVLLKRGEIILRAWSGELPQGWKPPRRQKRESLKSALSLALFAKELEEADGHSGRLQLIDRLQDENALSAAAIPFAAEVFWADERRHVEGNLLVDRALELYPEHLGILSAAVDDARIDNVARAERLLKLAEVADLKDEVWVASRAWLSAARIYQDRDDVEQAAFAAGEAYEVDPTLAEAGQVRISTLLRQGKLKAAEKVAKATIERLRDLDEAAKLCLEIALVAQKKNELEIARHWLHRGLRDRDRASLLQALVQVEILCKECDVAAEFLTRLMLLDDDNSRSLEERAAVQVLAADLSLAQGDPASARAQLATAARHRPRDEGISLKLAQLYAEAGEVERALEALALALDEENVASEILLFAAELRLAQGSELSAKRVQALLERLDDDERNTPEALRISARAIALLGDVLPLANQLEKDALAANDNKTSSTEEKDALWGAAFALLAKAGENGRAVKALKNTNGALSVEALSSAVHEAAHPDALREELRPHLVGEPDKIRMLAHQLAALGNRNEALAWVKDFTDVEDDRFIAENALEEEHLSLRKSALLRLAERGEQELKNTERLTVFECLAQLLASEKSWSEAAKFASKAVTLGSDMRSEWVRFVIHAEHAPSTLEYLLEAEDEVASLPNALIRQVRDLLEAQNEQVELRAVLAEHLLENEDALLNDHEDGSIVLAEDAEALLRVYRECKEDEALGQALGSLGLRFQRCAWIKEAVPLLVAGGDVSNILEAEELLKSALVEDTLAEELAPFCMVFAAEHERALLLRDSAEICLSSAKSFSEQTDVYRSWLSGVDFDEAEVQEVATSWLHFDAGAWGAAHALLKKNISKKQLEEKNQILLRKWGEAYQAEKTEEAIVVMAELENLAKKCITMEAFCLELALDVLPQTRADSDEHRAKILERLALLAHRDGELERAVGYLHSRIECGDPGRFEANNRMGDWLSQSENHAAEAMAAFAEALRIEPDALGVSEKLLRLLEKNHSDDAVQIELKRRAKLPQPPEDEAEIWRRLGRYQEPKDSQKAMFSYLKALKLVARGEAWEQKLFEQCNALPFAERWKVRFHLAALRGVANDDVVACEHAIAAAEIFSEALGRPRAALSAYQVAQVRGTSSVAEAACWPQVKIYQDLGDAEGALTVLDDLLKLVNERRQADVLDVKASIFSKMHGDIEGAFSLRREIAAKWPAHRGNALQLERMLLGERAFLEAFRVRRKAAELDEDFEFKTRSFLLLVQRAENELEDLSLAVEVMGQLVNIEPQVASHRLHRILLAERLGDYALIVEDSAIASQMPELSVSDRVALAFKNAETLWLKQEKPAEAIECLTFFLKRHSTDALQELLFQVLRNERRFDEAASLWSSLLEEYPDGNEHFGTRREMLERFAHLQEDAGLDGGAFESLCEAAALGRLSDESALRFARLAEQADDDVNALTALEWILERADMQPEHRLATLGRQALLAERVGRLELALSAWRERAERLPNDLAAWQGVERISQELEALDARREAARSLLRLGSGDLDDRISRLLFLGRDGRDRNLDLHLALADFSLATELENDIHLRRERRDLALKLADDSEVFAAFEHMRKRGDKLTEEEWLQSAQASARIQKPRRALEAALQAMERGVDADGNVMSIFEKISTEVQPQLGLSIVNRLHRDDDVGLAIVKRILPYLQDVANLPLEVVVQLAEAFPDESRFVLFAANTEKEDGDVVRAADRLLRLANTRAEIESEKLEAQAAKWLLDSNIDVGILLGRLDALLSVLAKDDSFRNDALRILRDGEAWPAVVQLLERSVDVTADEKSRVLRLELVDILRSELEAHERAAAHLERLLSVGPDDRLAWGALLETLEELDEKGRLADALGRRAGRVSGLEQRELVRRRVQLSLENNSIGEGLVEQVAQLRDAQTGDDDFDHLYWQILETQGPMTLRRALLDEVKNGDAQAVRKQAAIRLLHNEYFSSLPLDERVQCRLVAAGTDVDFALKLVEKLALQPAAQAAEESVGFICALIDDAQEQAASRLLKSAGHWGSRELLNAAERLFAAEIARDNDELVVLSAARALKVRGGPAAQSLLLSANTLSEESVAASALHRAIRGHAIDELLDVLTSSTVNEEQANHLSSAFFLEGKPAFAPQLNWVDFDVDEVEVAVGLIRAQKENSLLWVSFLDAPKSERLLRRLSRLQVKSAQVPALVLAFKKCGQKIAPALLERAARQSVESQRLDAVDALDLYLNQIAETFWAVCARAQWTLENDVDNSAQWCSKAADKSENLVDKRQWRREAAAQYLRLDNALLAGSELQTWVQEDEAALPAALELAQAAGLENLVDDFFAIQGGVETSLESIRIAALARAQHRLFRMKDVLGAFSVLYDAALRHNDDALMQEAYVLSAREGLLAQQALALKDELAKAACLFSLGRVDAALEVIQNKNDVAALLFKASIFEFQQDFAQQLDCLLAVLLINNSFEMRLKVHSLRIMLSDDVSAAWEATFADAKNRTIWPKLCALFVRDFTGTELSSKIAKVALLWNDDVQDLIVVRLLAQCEGLSVAQNRNLALQVAQTTQAEQDWRTWLDQVMLEAPDIVGDEIGEALQAARINSQLAEHRAWPMLISKCDESLLCAYAVPFSGESPLNNLLFCAAVENQCKEAIDAFLNDIQGLSISHLLRVATKRKQAELWLSAMLQPAAQLFTGELPHWFSVQEEERALILLHLNGAISDVYFLERVYEMMATGNNRVLLAGYLLRIQPRDEAAWNVLACSSSSTATFFKHQISLFDVENENTTLESAQGDDWKFLFSLREKKLAQPVNEPEPQNAFLQARRQSKESRQEHWYALAKKAAESEADSSSMRFLKRAGRSLENVELGIRLRLDADLQDPKARSRFISQRLKALREAEAIPDVELAERALLENEFAQLQNTGETCAEDRANAVGLRLDSFEQVVDAYDAGWEISAQDFVQSLKKNATQEYKKRASAVCHHIGLEDVAQALLPKASALYTGKMSPLSFAYIALQAGTTLEHEEELRTQLEPLKNARVMDASLARQLAIEEDITSRVLLWTQRLELAGSTQKSIQLLEAAASDTEDAAFCDAWLATFEVKPAAGEEYSLTIAEMRKFAQALELHLKLQSDPEQIWSATLKLSSMLRQKLNAPLYAYQILQQYEKRMGVNATILAELGEAAEACGEGKDAVEHYIKAAEVETDNSRRQILLNDAADLLIEQGEIKRAAVCLEKNVDEDNARAALELEKLCSENALAESLVHVLQYQKRQAKEVEDLRGAAMALAQHLAHPLGRRNEAIEVLEAQAMQDKEDRETRLVLARWYEDESRTLDAALALESASNAGDASDSEAVMAAAHSAVLLSALGNLERAGPLAQRALVHDVVDDALYAVAEAWFRQQHLYAELDELIGKQLLRVEDLKQRSLLWVERAKIRSDELSDEESAHQALLECLQCRADQPEALERLKVYAHENNRWPEYRAVLSRAVEISDDKTQSAHWLQELALVDGKHLNDIRAAQNSLSRAAELVPDSLDVVMAQAELLLETGALEEIPTLLKKVRVLGGKSIAPRLILAEGDALLAAGMREDAIASYQILKNEGELLEEVQERILQAALAGDDKEEMALAFRDARRRSENADERFRLAKKEAAAWQEKGNIENAISVWCEILDENSTSITALDALFALCEHKNSFALMSERFKKAAEKSTDDKLKVSFLLRRAALLKDKLNQSMLAGDVFAEVLALDGNVHTAKIGLAQIAVDEKDYERAYPLLTKISENEWEFGALSLLEARAEAAVFLTADDVEMRLKAVLKVEPKHVWALEQWVQWARKNDALETLEFALESLCGAFDPHKNAEELAFLLVELSKARRRLGQLTAAAAAVERAYELESESEIILRELVAVKRAAADEPELALALRALLPFVETEEHFALERERISLLEKSHQLVEAANIAILLLEVPGANNDDIATATRLAMASGDADALARMGLAVRDTQTEVDVLELQVQGFIHEGKPQKALDLLMQAVSENSEKTELVEQGMALAHAGTATHKLFFGEQMLRFAKEKSQRMDAALLAGRAARDELQDTAKAAELLFEAHQCAPENLELRLELTSLYASMERLLPHAQTGVVQLLKRAPTDARVYKIAAKISTKLGMLDKRASMVAAVALVESCALTPEVAPPGPLLPDPNPISVSESELRERLAPETYLQTRAFADLMCSLGSDIELDFVENVSLLARSKRLADVLPSSVAQTERIDQLFPGRPLKILVGHVSSVKFHPGAVLHAVLPESILHFGDAVIVAFLARTFASARLGGMLADECSRDEMVALRKLLTAAFIKSSSEDAIQKNAQRLLSKLPADEKSRAFTLASSALHDEHRASSRDVMAWRDGVRTLSDRFALLVSGSLPGALAAGALPGLLSDSPSITGDKLMRSERAIDLCRFAAGTELWALRRSLGLLPNLED